MTDTVTTQNIDLSSWDNLYRPIYNVSKPERFSFLKYKSQLIPLAMDSLSYKECYVCP